MAASTCSVVSTSVFVFVLVSLKSLGSTSTGGDECVWTFARCSNSTPSYPKEIGDCCGGNITTSNGTTACRRERQDVSVWSQWQEWTPWHPSCPGGSSTVRQTRERERQCEPCNDCQGHNTSSDARQSCCPIDGSWGTWSQWSSDSATCGNVQNTRHRSCQGHRCGGSCFGGNATDSRTTYKCCGGNWSDWSTWGQWSSPCGPMSRFRSRTCVSDTCPCFGETNDPDFDNTCCPVDGGWDVVAVGNWSSSCGWAQRTVNQSCINPSPSCNGKDCQGSSTYTERRFRGCGSLVASENTAIITGIAAINSISGAFSSVLVSQSRIISSPSPQGSNEDFWSEFNLGIAMAIIAVPLVVFIPVIIGVIVCAVRTSHQKSMAVLQGRQGGRPNSPPSRYRSNLPLSMKPRTWSSSLRNLWQKGNKRPGPSAYNVDSTPENNSSTIIGNLAAVPVGTGRAVEHGIIDDQYAARRQVSRRESENILYEQYDDVIANPVALAQQLQSRSPESEFPILVPMQSFTRLPIDQRPRQPLPLDSPGPLNRIMQPSDTVHVHTSSGVLISGKRRVSTISQPVDSNRAGVLVTNMSPQGFSTLERRGSLELQKAVARQEGERQKMVSLRESYIDPGYETLSKFSSQVSPSTSPPIHAASPVATSTEAGGVATQIEIPVTVHAEPTRHTYVNENEQERAMMLAATLPVESQARPHQYMPMALRPQQGSVELVRAGKERQITYVSNPMYSYPLSDEAATRQGHAAKPSIVESGYRSKTMSPTEGVDRDAPTSPLTLPVQKPADMTDVTAESDTPTYWI